MTVSRNALAGIFACLLPVGALANGFLDDAASALGGDAGAGLEIFDDLSQEGQSSSRKQQHGHGGCSSKMMQGVLKGAGVQDLHMAGGGGAAKGDTMQIEHNAGFSAFSRCEEEWKPESIAQLKLLGKSLAFTVDLSKVGCACNLAFYLISMPARDWSGKYHEGKDRGGQPKYYCDANQVGGQWCPEVDIMEANNRVLQSTAHKCDAPQNGHYSYCDRSGCAKSTNDRHGSYGPGHRYTIDTRRPFRVLTEFPEQGGKLTGMRAILRQDDRKVVMAHDDCDWGYLEALTGAMRDGMSLRITYWGDQAETMEWMDRPVCGSQSCSGSHAGPALISNLTVAPLSPSAAPSPAATTAAPQGQTSNKWWSPPTAAPQSTSNKWWSPTPAPAPQTSNKWWSPPTPAPSPAEADAMMQWVPDTSVPWECHEYVGDQEKTQWCATAGIQGGFEFHYNGGDGSECGGCWCCKRKAKQVLSVWVFSDRDDKLFGQPVPSELLSDRAKFVQMGEHGIVSLQGNQHFVKRSNHGEADSVNMFLRRFSASEHMDHALGASPARWPAMLPIAIAAMVAVAAVTMAARKLCGPRRSVSEAGAGPGDLNCLAWRGVAPRPAAAPLAAEAMGPQSSVPNEFPGAFTMPGQSPLRRKRSGVFPPASSSTAAAAATASVGPMTPRAAIRRAGSSCQKLLTSMSGEQDA